MSAKESQMDTTMSKRSDVVYPESEKKEGKTIKDGDDGGNLTEERNQWGNQFQFVLTALGLAVGLGNIWRFPSEAYENGGAAFLIPYLCCGLIFGLPMVYAEFMMGQYSRSGPGLYTGRYAAGWRGFGWCAAINSIVLSVYYCVIIAWCGVYFSWVVSGQSGTWTECGNYWNTENCVTQEQLKFCRENNGTDVNWFNNSCTVEKHPELKGAVEEFFTNYMTTRSTGFLDIGGFNWPVFGALAVLWLATCGILLKGLKIMGYLSYIIVPFPYIVVCILFVRGVTLDGAHLGIEYYLTKPDFSKLLVPKTWAAALKQLMFSMNVGYGGLVSLSSYSKPSNNFFRDALIIIFGDTIMSVIGGVAVFSVLGYLAKLTHKSIPDVVSSGTSLAFIVYPEAIATMAVPWLWNGLFFLMLFFLGISSEIALVETFTGLVFDCFPKTTEKKWLVTVATCGICLASGVIMVTHSGWYWFNLFDEFSGSTCACLVAFGEVFVLTCYGWKQIKQDLAEMRGEPRSRGIAAWFGPRSPLFGILWATLCPALALTIAVLVAWRDTIPHEIPLDKEGGKYTLPMGFEILGWCINLGMCLPIPAFFIYKLVKLLGQGKSLCYLFRPSRGLPSYRRYYEQNGIPEPDEIQPPNKDEPSATCSSPEDHTTKTTTESRRTSAEPEE